MPKTEEIKKYPLRSSDIIGDEGHFIICDEGPDRFPMPSHNLTIKKWNTRPTENKQGE